MKSMQQLFFFTIFLAVSDHLSANNQAPLLLTDYNHCNQQKLFIVAQQLNHEGIKLLVESG